jgi:dTDP-4-amino-4,6-dideoxygalactose transaminase
VIPISSVALPAAAIDAAVSVMKSGRLAQGAVVAEAEARFAELQGARHAVAVNSGTTALVAAIQALDLQPGDEVLTSPFTFVATLNAILEAGATATFADISAEDFNLDPAKVAEAVGPRTKVLLPVHLYGQAADMGGLGEIAAAHGLAVVEDAAQAHGATFGGRGVGTFGIGCFSLYGTKNLTTGEGGMVTTDDDAIADYLRVSRNQGMRARYEYVMAGHNYRLTDMQAALLGPQLDAYAGNLATRRANAARLASGLDGTPGLVVPRQLPGRKHVWHQFTVRVTPEARLTRDQLAAGLAEAGVGSGVYYPRVVFDYPVYAAHPRVKASPVPVAEQVAREVLSLPVHPGVSPADVDVIVGTVRGLLA